MSSSQIGDKGQQTQGASASSPEELSSMTRVTVAAECLRAHIRSHVDSLGEGFADKLRELLDQQAKLEEYAREKLMMLGLSLNETVAAYRMAIQAYLSRLVETAVRPEHI